MLFELNNYRVLNSFIHGNKNVLPKNSDVHPLYAILIYFIRFTTVQGEILNFFLHYILTYEHF